MNGTGSLVWVYIPVRNRLSGYHCTYLQILDDIFAAQMQRLQGRALEDKDFEPPRSVAEARSMLSRDTRTGADSFY